MDDQHVHHIVEPLNEHSHDFLNDPGVNFELLELHQVFQITSVAEVHEHVISGVGLDCLPELDHVVTVDGVLVLDLADDELLFRIIKVVPFDDFASNIVSS